MGWLRGPSVITIALVLSLLLVPAIAGPCGHGVKTGTVSVPGEPEDLDTTLLHCPPATHTNIAAYISEVERAFERYIAFYTDLYADLKLEHLALTAHCVRCEASVGDIGGGGYGVATLGTSSADAGGKALPAGCASVATSCPSDAFCVDRYRSPTGVHECSLKTIDLRDACLLAEDPGMAPCAGAAELALALRFMEKNVLERYPIVLERLGVLRAQLEAAMRAGALDGDTAREAQAELDIILGMVLGSAEPVGGMDIDAYQRAVSRHVTTLASPVLRDDVTTHHFSRPATMVRLVVDEVKVWRFCKDQGIDECDDVLARARECCEEFGVEACSATSDGAGGSSRAESAFCTTFKLCKEQTYGRQVRDANVDPWSANLIRLLEVFTRASGRSLFVNETQCLDDTFVRPPPAAPCETHCMDCYRTRRSHCHPQTGTCVCEMGDEWRRTLQRCVPRPRPDVEACCMRLFPTNALGGVKAAASGGASCDLAELYGLTYDRCQTTSSSSGLCCRLGLREVPVDEGCLAGEDSCLTECQKMARGDRALVDRCTTKCEAADISCERECFRRSPDLWKGCIETCATLPLAALDCTLGCRGEDLPELCARMCRARAPVVELVPDLLLAGEPAELLIVGEAVTASLRVQNVGITTMSGTAELSLLMLTECRCGECLSDRSCECTCKERRTGTVTTLAIPTMDPGDSKDLTTAPLSLGAGQVGSYLRALITVRDRTGVMVAQAMGPIRAYDHPPEAMVVSARMLVDGRPVTRVYPGMSVVGEVRLSSRTSPVKVELALTAGGRFQGTVRTHTLWSEEDGVSLKTDPIVVSSDWADLVLGIHATARASSGTLFQGPLTVYGTGRDACALPHLTNACRDATTPTGRSYPDAYAEVVLPRLEAVGARFLAGDASVVNVEPGGRVFARVVMRNMARIPFSGNLGLKVIGSGAGLGEAVMATGSELVSRVAPGANITVNTIPFRVQEGATYILQMKATDTADLVWAEGDIDPSVHPSAKLIGGYEAVEGDRVDIAQDIEVGDCALAIRCNGCIPSCELKVDTDACRVDVHHCGCTCSVRLLD